MELHFQCGSKGTKEMGHKFSSTVRGDMAQNTMLGEDVEDKELCNLWRHDGIVSQDEK